VTEIATRMGEWGFLGAVEGVGIHGVQKAKSALGKSALARFVRAASLCTHLEDKPSLRPPQYIPAIAYERLGPPSAIAGPV
jgi:hypothetical protein